MVRLFTTLYPSPEANDHLDLALASVGGALVADSGGAVRWSPKEQRHVTLSFHGEVPEGAVPGYLEELTAVLDGVRAFDLGLAGAGTFQDRVFWAGIGEEGRRPLGNLISLVVEAAATAGIGPESPEGGRPHLTLARASVRAAARERNQRNRRRPAEHDGAAANAALLAKNLFADWARALAVYRGPLWTAAEVVMVQSALGEGPGGGSVYTKIAVVRLG